MINSGLGASQISAGLGVGRAASGVAPWWLTGGVNPALVTGAYRAKGAESYVASKSNLASPGTNVVTDDADAPSWDAAGWLFSGSEWLAIATMPVVYRSAIFVQYTVTSGTNGLLWGTFSGQWLWPNHLTLGVGYLNSFSLPALQAGNLGVSGTDTYRDGVFDRKTGGLVSTTGLQLGRLYNGSWWYRGYIEALWTYAGEVTADQAAAISAAMAAL